MTLLSIRGLCPEYLPRSPFSALRKSDYTKHQKAEECVFLAQSGKGSEIMEKLEEILEQTLCFEPESSMGLYNYQSLQDHYQVIMDHQQSLMDHYQALMDHFRTAQALYRAVLDSQRSRRGQQVQIDRQIYCRALRNHQRLVEIHRQMLKEYSSRQELFT